MRTYTEKKCYHCNGTGKIKEIDRNFTEELFCDHCEKDTLHNCIDGGHERDSSQDYQECIVCNWYKYGMGGEYEPPI